MRQLTIRIEDEHYDEVLLILSEIEHLKIVEVLSNSKSRERTALEKALKLKVKYITDEEQALISSQLKEI